MALHQALIPNWTSPAFSKFVDATRALVDELANITTTRDGKEEMSRCEEIFRQICWLQERFWPDVDGMGEEDESGRLGPAGLGPMSAGVGGMDNGMNNAMSGGMNNNMGSGMNNNMNNTMASALSASSMNGPAMNGSTMNGQGINGQGLNGGDGNSVGDGRNTFGGLEGVGQN
jgi:hypothetical protein